MAMGPGLRKLVLAVHLSVSVGWVGAAAAYLCLGLAAARSEDPAVVRAAWIAMELVGWAVIVPLALAALVTGLAMALGTRWGLLRHYWVLFSFVLTSFATLVLVLHMPTVSATADATRVADAEQLARLGGDVGHPAIGLVLLVAVQVLNIYKPRGLTPYGRRKLRDQRAAPEPQGAATT